jgi:hypothetical protein
LKLAELSPRRRFDLIVAGLFSLERAGYLTEAYEEQGFHVVGSLALSNPLQGCPTHLRNRSQRLDQPLK